MQDFAKTGPGNNHTPDLLTRMDTKEKNKARVTKKQQKTYFK
jgi:hypothetical protein